MKLKNSKFLYQELVLSKYKNIYDNVMKVPKILKVTLNLGIKNILKNKGPKALQNIMQDLYNISGQKPLIIRAKRSCDGFEIKKGEIIHLKVTLRKNNMYAFLTKLALHDLPRTRDFQGLSIKSFDQDGNYSFGINDCTAFHGIDKKNIFAVFGFNITITTNTDTTGTKMLLEDLYFVFKEE